jgi:ribosomal protein S18 acetylase RimI-like enzyme
VSDLDVKEVAEGETAAVAAALLALRPELGDVATLVARVDAQRAAGYRVVGSFEPGDREAGGAAGFRLGENLAWGRFLYVDDLATRPDRFGRGHGGALMRWLEAEARRAACDELHLDSGVGLEREAAHRLYFRHHMRIASYHFLRKLA